MALVAALIAPTPNASTRRASAGAISGRCTGERGVIVDDRFAEERVYLLKAATEVLQRSGWWGFKVDSVLRRAGLSTRSFYRHFEKKSDMLLALLVMELGNAAEAMSRITAAATTPADKVRAYVSATIDMAYDARLAKPTSLFASRWRELLPENPELIEECVERLIAPLVAAIGDGKSQGTMISDDPVADAWAIFYLVSSITADQAALGGWTPRENIEHIVMPFITRAIGLG